MSINVRVWFGAKIDLLIFSLCIQQTLVILKAMSIGKNYERLSDMQTSTLTAYQDSDLQSRYKHIKGLSRVQKPAVLNINEDFLL